MGLATVTAGGGGPPACCFCSPQLATKVATASRAAILRAPNIKESDETGPSEFMDSCTEAANTACPHSVDSELCPPAALGNPERKLQLRGAARRKMPQSSRIRTASERSRHKRPARRPKGSSEREDRA